MSDWLKNLQYLGKNQQILDLINHILVKSIRYKLPIPQPITLTRFHLNELSEYWVAEKSDGDRLLLYINNTQLYFITRELECYSLKVEWKIEGQYLMDGEMVMNQTNQTWEYLIFDMVYFENKSTQGLTLERRLSYIIAFIKKYRQQKCVLFFKILGKTMQPMSQLSLLVKNIKNGMFTEKRSGGQVRSNLTDGLIFTPLDRTYSECVPLKWKPPHQLTIDFRVKWVKDQIHLLLGSNEKQEQVVEILTGSQVDQSGLTLQHHNKIIEMYWTLGYWHYYKQRDDKMTPNFITVGWSVLKSIAENITWEDLLK